MLPFGHTVGSAISPPNAPFPELVRLSRTSDPVEILRGLLHRAHTNSSVALEAITRLPCEFGPRFETASLTRCESSADAGCSDDAHYARAIVFTACPKAG